MAGLDELPDAVTIARLVRDVTGHEPSNPRPLGSGVTTIAWRVETDDEPIVVLVERPLDAAVNNVVRPRFGAQLAIYEALEGPPGLVPGAIAWSGDEESQGLARFDLPWAMVTEARGQTGEADDLRAAGVADLGAWLARLHALPCTGLGLLEDRRDRLTAPHTEMAAALLERWSGLWPFDGTSLIAHPIARLAPALVEPASRFREALLRFGQLTKGVVLHSDLNPVHVFLAEGRVTTVIDFSDAFIGPAAADLAVFASHYGWERTEQLLETYAASAVLRETRLAESHLFGVAVGLYRVRKRFLGQQPRERIERDIAFLGTTIEHAAHLLRG
ncbi:MAG: aminoglycoside phosphotransferase family protein [Dehalococcoidia bacterium]|nr:aminoglycoside phosphotransferase family protein [Dehalococcoidia bacterium]